MSKDTLPGISIFNFDPVEQNKIWLQLGPTEGRKLLIGVLRTALLLGPPVEFDRNQIFEGVFFTATSPDLLRWHLGIEPGAELPFRVRMLPSRTEVAVTSKPWTLQSGEKHWGVATKLGQEILANRQDVQNPDRPSSPLIALSGGSYQLENDMMSSHSTSGASVVEEQYKKTDPVLMPQHIWDMRDKSVILQLREQGRDRWAQEMLSGLVEVVPHGKHRNPQAEFGDFLITNPKPYILHGNGLPDIKALENCTQCSNGSCAVCATAIIGNLIDSLESVREISKLTPEGQQSMAPKHVSSRSFITRWLDGETVPELTIPRLPTELSKVEYAGHRSAALAWWTKAYYSWITYRDGNTLLTLSGALQSPTGYTGEDAEKVENLWKIEKTKTKPLERLGILIRFLRKNQQSQSFTLSGEVVTELSQFTPDQFSRLRASLLTSGDKQENLAGKSEITPHKVRDLSVAVHELRVDSTSRSIKIRQKIARVLLATLTGIGLVIFDNSEWAAGNSVLAGIAFAVALLLAIPWSEITALFNLTNTQTLVKLEASQSNNILGKQSGLLRANAS